METRIVSSFSRPLGKVLQTSWKPEVFLKHELLFIPSKTTFSLRMDVRNSSKLSEITLPYRTLYSVH
jgi:hypothetical protein